MHLAQYHDEAAEEILQETWIVAVTKLNKFEHRSTLKTWLAGILYNKWRELSRKEKTSESMSFDESQHKHKEDPVKQTASHIDLQQAISQLADGYREVLVLHDIEGYKHREIADILDISEGTSKSQLHHARVAMRKLLGEQYER